MPEATPKPDEQIAAEAMRDISRNVSGKDQWRDYDERYVTQRILRAIQQGKGN
jgi:hypothetical protein